MKVLENYNSVLRECVNNISEILSKEEFEELINQKEQLISILKNSTFIKVPFVGDFSAGKSSLLNAIINEDELLPTDFRPTTAVSYELHYCNKQEEQRIIKIDSSKEKTEEFALKDLAKLELFPGDVIELYLHNEVVKKYYDKNIILVDMPGIDSGYEAHQKAIFNYLENGTVFVIVNDIEFGNLRSSTLNFIKEINKYDLESLIVVSKADKKLPSEVDKVVLYITNQVKTILKTNYDVVKVSAHDNEISEVVNFINKLDSAKLFEERFRSSVIDFIDLLISKLKLRKDFLSQDEIEFNDRINNLEFQKKEIKSDLERTITDLPKIQDQVTDMLNQMRTEVILNTNEFVSLIFEGKMEDVKERVMGIVRPIFIDFTQSKSMELDGLFSDTLARFDDKLNNNLSNDSEKVSFFNNSMVNSIPLSFSKGSTKFVTKMLSKNTIIKAGQFLARFGGYLVVGVAAAATIIHLFKKNKKENEVLQKQEEAKGEFRNSIVNNIISELRDTVTNALIELQDGKKEAFVSQTNSALDLIEKEIKDVRDERNESNFNIEEEISKVNKVIEQLMQLKKSL